MRRSWSGAAEVVDLLDDHPVAVEEYGPFLAFQPLCLRKKVMIWLMARCRSSTTHIGRFHHDGASTQGLELAPVEAQQAAVLALRALAKRTALMRLTELPGPADHQDHVPGPQAGSPAA